MNHLFIATDRVYSCIYGWCTVDKVDLTKKEYHLTVESTGLPIRSSFDNAIKHFSYNEYTLKGFNLHKPEPLPEVGQIVWVKDNPDDRWVVSHFVKYVELNDDGDKVEYPYQVSDDCDEDDTSGYKYLTKFNPYLMKGYEEKKAEKGTS